MASNPSGDTSNDNDKNDILELLSQLQIEPCFHDLLSVLCGGKSCYLRDIEVGDLQGQKDSSGDTVPPAVARGLVRKIQAGKISNNNDGGVSGGEDVLSTSTTNSQTVATAKENSNGTCTVSLQRGDGEYSSLICCNIKGHFSGDNNGGSRGRRCKVFVAILDNSGSMRQQWPLVVEAIGRVYTDELIADPSVSLGAVAYNTDASEVRIPTTSDELQRKLRLSYSPGGITNFQSAFEKAWGIIQREISGFMAKGIKASNIDVTTLLFTDGADTSVPPLGYVTQAATKKARDAGDAFRTWLGKTDCPSYISVAAFGEHHNPEQCQYLSDRYYYINRQEVLSEWLAGGLSEMLQSCGYVTPKITLPQGLVMVEPMPKSIGLNPDGCIEQEIWLRDESQQGISHTEEVKIALDDAGSSMSLQCTTMLSSATVIHSETLDGRTFLIESAEMQLRQIALELRGKKPSPAELALLREKLMGVKESVKHILETASNPKTRIQGRSLLLARLDDLETRRNRISYTLGHFEVEKDGDTRSIGAVGIDAVLRDASQKVPLSNEAREWSRIVDAANVLLPMEKELSSYGRRSTFDPISGCDARIASSFGDVMFYRLDGKSFSTAVDCGDEPISYEVFTLLSENRKKPVMANDGKSFTRVGIPMYVTARHFSRVQLFLPMASKQLSDDGVYIPLSSERMFLELLSRSLASHLGMDSRGNYTSANGTDNLTLLQKARSVYAILDSKIKDNCESLLDEWLRSAEKFTNDPKSRDGVINLYEIASIGLLAADSWPSQQITKLGEALREESMRRILVSALQNKSDSERMHLAWSVLGYSTSNEWKVSPLKDPTTKVAQSCEDQFDILTASSQLKCLEATFPGEYCPRDVTELVHILTSTNIPKGSLRMSECFALSFLFSRWGELADKARDGGGVWKLLDSLMLEDGSMTQQDEISNKLDAIFLSHTKPQTLQDILVRPMESLSQFATHCLQDLPFHRKNKGNNEMTRLAKSPRLELAFAIDSLVAEREKLAKKYVIKDAEYPSKGAMSAKEWAKNWGSEASPVDMALYIKVRSQVHRKNFDKPLTVKEALTDKVYRKHGGNFAFPSQLDTFIPGLHRRTRDLHSIWQRIGKETGGPQARKDAVEEMLLRLRWDDRDRGARAKLSTIVGIIWDGLEHVPPGLPVSSALWLQDGVPSDDEDDYSLSNVQEPAKGMEGKDVFITRKQSKKDKKGDSKADDWSVITGE